ncbi:Uma2 family endonuclease [Streptomyces sp. NPDC017979]|uniref:Uma2 family endonuclease n=1 Tax=Streptomyces sp. NPDC017979 TaxID=3365024 RepID=UPI00378DD2BC
MGGTMTAKATDYSKHRQPDGSAWPMPPQDGYTMDDYFALDLPPHTEMIDGSLVFVSPQRKFHSLAMFLFEVGLRQRVPQHLRVRREMAVVLGRKNVPEPDLVVVTAESDGDQDQTRYEAADVVLAVEVVSPDSESRDRDTKPRKYAAAGIPHFWLVEMEPRSEQPVVHTFTRDADSGAYVSTGVFRDRLKLAEPFEIDIDLTELDRL